MDHWNLVSREKVFELLIDNFPGNIGLLFDGQAKFDTWKNEYGDGYTRMRHISSGNQHGIVREVKSGGYFWEGTFLNGEVSGLLIGYFKNFIKVFMY